MHLARSIGSLVTAAVAGAALLCAGAAEAAGMPDGSPGVAVPAGSLGAWQQGQWWVDATQLRSWHQQGVTGAGVSIALIDGPVFTGIPELAGQDVRPSGTLCDRDLWRSWGPTTPDGPLDDTSFHTTSMAALMVGNGHGNGPGGVGVLGVAPGATLRTYAMFNTKDPSAHQNLDCWAAGYAGLIDTIVSQGAEIIEIPVGIDVLDDTVQAAYNRAYAHGVVIVASSGNGGAGSPVMSPGGNHGVLVVGGVRADGQVLDTNPTSLLDSWDQARTLDQPYNIHLVAPGADLVGGGLSPGNRWDSAVLQNGSSGASAIVAGQLALLRQKWPKATSNQLVYSLLRNARRLEGSVVWGPRRGFGTTSFEATLTMDPTGYPDVNPIYAGMANVYSDHPTPPDMPQQVGADGRLPTSPTEPTQPTGAAGTTGVAPRGAAGAQAALVAGPVTNPVTTTSGTAWLVWLVGGLLAVGALLGGGWRLTRNRRPSSDVESDETHEHHPETVGTTVGRSAGRPDPQGRDAQGEDTP